MQPPEYDPLQVHPPERRQLARKYVVLYSCCCCCCCCLHTLGGLIGSTVAGDCQPDSKAPHAQGMFWQCVFIVIAISIAGALYVGAYPEIFFILAILGPLFLLAASLLMAAWIGLRKDLPSRKLYMHQLGRITAGNVFGTIVGILIMIVIGVALSAAF